MAELNSPRLEMRAISKRFGATIALDKVSFQVFSSEIHALVGENGAGKSTLMKILSGAHLPDRGDMLLDSKPYQPRNPLDGRLKGVGMIYQELSLAPHLTVEENILLGMESHQWGWINRKESRQRVQKALDYFAHPEIKPDRIVSHLSVGAQQLVEIARSLAVGCRVLVFDEPTSSLSQTDITTLFKIIRELKKRGISIIYISHFLEEIQEIADRVTVLRDGSVVATRLRSQASNTEIVHMMVGRAVKDLYPRSKRMPGEALLTVKDIAGIKKPLSASLILYRGEVLGIAGLVGAGRTEFIRALFGLDPVRRGEINIGTFRGTALPVQRWQQGVGMVSENRKEEGLVLNLSVADNITLSNLKGLGPFNLIMPARQSAITDQYIQKLDIRCQAPFQKMNELSGGNQQKAALARLLHHNVDILLLDEPTRGIDVASKVKIYQVIDQLALAGKAVLMISSYLPELLGICDRIAVMHRGILSNARPVRELTEHQVMLAATGQDII
jgi:ribose transport system ATP-binding protein